MLSIFTNNCYIRRNQLTSLIKILNINLVIRNKHTDLKMVLNSREALVYHEKGAETFDLMLRYECPTLKLDRQFNFSRRINETVDLFVNKLNNNITKILMKKEKKFGDALKEILKKDISLYKDDIKISGGLSFETILEDVNNLKLVIFDVTFIIKKNMPIVNRLTLASSILCGFPTYPAKFNALYTDNKISNFSWYKTNKEDSKQVWLHVGDGYFYIPNVSDIGCRLKFSCTPRNDKDYGPLSEVESKDPVEAGPGPCPFDTRHIFTNFKLTGKSFRVTSYNILAESYSSTTYSKENLFPYCPAYALEMNYRKQLILKELIGFNSDIICLQEVDNKIYENDLVPNLSLLGYKSVFNTKNSMSEGLAIFFNNDRFEELCFDFTVIGHNTEMPKFVQVWSKIKNEKAKKRFLDRNTTAQIIALKSKERPSDILVITNTHLYFHPDADHIRLLQGYYILLYIEKFVENMKMKCPDSNVSILLCGDFNSVPECGIYQLMTENYIPENYKDWSSNLEETVKDISLTHNISFASACGTPTYTNYTPVFSGCLDYIFYEKNKLEVEQVIPMPSLEEISVNIGLPSIVFPSDHISLCADLKWIA
ncbi:PREDICTED: 2',5'-phosphodiesterase 12 [Polistes canadensis]|uniref:2',5'-phosphodiesterase 12 n=1 Tax=Polistes canadensis TaxID=91411 RepID=UPI000718C70F|nr:PREDICTED: 2',5'-phosphodiesterase 12 [Polistes canadensis]